MNRRWATSGLFSTSTLKGSLFYSKTQNKQRSQDAGVKTLCEHLKLYCDNCHASGHRDSRTKERPETKASGWAGLLRILILSAGLVKNKTAQTAKWNLLPEALTAGGETGRSHPGDCEASVQQGPALLGSTGVFSRRKNPTCGHGTKQLADASWNKVAAFLAKNESQKHFLSINRGVTVECANYNRVLSVAA